MQVYREKELAIAEAARKWTMVGKLESTDRGQVKKALLGAFANTINLKTKQPLKKCLDQSFLRSHPLDGMKPPELSKIRVPISVLKQVPTVQESVVEFMILKMFRTDSIFSLLDILFADMQSDTEIFAEASEEALEHLAN